MLSAVLLTLMHFMPVSSLGLWQQTATDQHTFKSESCWSDWQGFEHQLAGRCGISNDSAPEATNGAIKGHMLLLTNAEQVWLITGDWYFVICHKQKTG